MKILWVFNHPAPYKVDFFSLLGEKCDLTVLFERDNESDRNSEFYKAKESNYESVHLHGIKLGPHNTYTNKIIPYFKKGYDLIVINGWSTLAEMKAIRYLHKHGIPYVFAINGGLIKKEESSLRKNLKTRHIKGASLYLCPDLNSKKYLLYYGAEEAKIRLFEYSTVKKAELIDAPKTKEERKAFYEKLGIKQEKVYLSIGQLIDRKRPLELLEWFKDAPKDCALVYLGEGPLFQEMAARIKKLGLDNIYMPGYKSHKETLEYLSYADASIFLTGEDIYGHVVNESLSQACPVIASPYSNAALKLIENGKDGFIVDTKEEFLKALSSIREEMRMGALKASSSETLEAMVESHLKIFGEFLG